MIRFFTLLFILVFISSCASVTNKKNSELLVYRIDMKLEDKAGTFDILRESGLSKNEKSYVSKYRVYPEADRSKILEQAVVFSRPGVLSKKIKVIRPEKSQYKVWFDGREYLSETKIDLSTRELVVKLESPESQWNGVERFKFPGGNGVFCYFSQLVECISYTGFFNRAIKAKRGGMSLHVIWDGYPYIGEQYLNIGNSPFAGAKVEYDGSTKEGEQRFSVNIAGSVIFYLFSDSYEYAKMFWPAQGFSLYHK